MQSEPDPSKDTYRLWPPGPRLLAALGASAVVALALAGGLAYAGGLFTPGRLTQRAIVDTFQQINGVHPGFRRNHTKGACIAGHFESNGAGQHLSKAVVFAPGTLPVTGRFAVAVGKPFVPDNKTQVRSLALRFELPGGEEWRTGMNDIPVFPVPTAQDFTGLMTATAPDPATGKPDPARVSAFFGAHPEVAAALKRISARPFASGFANASYNSLDAFHFVAADGTVTPVRWAMVAVDPYVAEPADQPGTPDPDYLFDDLAARLARGPVEWHLVATIGQPGDPTADATLPWPDDRQKVDLGTLTIDHIEAEAAGNCRDVNFDPLVLPAGIEPSDDPLLSARSAAYSVSFTRRAGEPKSPSEVQFPAQGGAPQ
ncbi:catalase family peroxidase [Ancylobacter mangrovi]|uniref:catalase family peroxidase n=1 Tax=Ancylobacter mangrovi TaxID=2972472 RepID=UPI0021620723|nr:catalase family peroxidase [Ancylobacter mangrovi]MCS0503776.1 catalase family peroxidase [Ancylobacter mangrovi]